MADTLVSLGGFTFPSWGVPERANGGGRQRLAVHELIGGGRVVDAMGWVPNQIKFSGRLRGGQATFQARLLETLARSGQPVVFAYWTNRYQVIVSSVSWKFERFYEITYDLVLEVLVDLTQDALQIVSASIDGLFNSDMALAQTAASGLASISGGIGNISAIAGQLGPLQSSTLTTVAPLRGAVGVTLTEATALQGSLEASLFPGQAVAGTNAAQLAAALQSRASGFQNLTACVLAVALLTRMQVNLAAVGQ